MTPTLRQDRPLGLLEKYQLSKELTKAYGTINITAHCYHPTRDSSNDLELFYASWLHQALTRLIIDHPMLSAIVRDKTDNSVHWAQLSHINLADIVTILPTASVSTEELIQKQTSTEFDLDSELPLWRLTILPDASLTQCWLTITVHHVIADGMSLTILLKHLIGELNHTKPTSNNPAGVVVPQTNPLPAAYENCGAPTLSIVWDVLPVLCRSLIPKVLPTNLAAWMDPLTLKGWQGDYAAIDGESHNTCLQLIKVASSTWKPLMMECKKRGVSPHALVFVAMVKAWARLYGNHTTEVATPVNCRGLCHPLVGADQIGNYTGAYTSAWTSDASTQDTWAMAAIYAQGLKNHKIDAAKKALLLQYLPNFPAAYCDFWYGKRKSSRMGRTGGLELSDLGRLVIDQGAWGTIEEVYFCQSAQVFTVALGVNAVTVEGALCCTVNWQKGSLDDCKISKYRDHFVAILKAL
jgi:NRPS condensation-like uncharacterized protein